MRVCDTDNPERLLPLGGCDESLYNRRFVKVYRTREFEKLSNLEDIALAKEVTELS